MQAKTDNKGIRLSKTGSKIRKRKSGCQKPVLNKVKKTGCQKPVLKKEKIRLSKTGSKKRKKIGLSKTGSKKKENKLECQKPVLKQRKKHQVVKYFLCFAIVSLIFRIQK